ncbi:beta-ketoacyl synthase N-terminal-like domain-containing protein [Microcoleus sp. S13C4]|uniref:beta-ketoacyl synthase N-terminal-like domain-containing protein n=1 Tax=Microcoleus sp. S13C4 TaxID=3055410 RepID=UPI002FD22E12
MKKPNENLKSEMNVERIISEQFEEDDQSLSILNENYSDTSTGETISFSPLSYGQQALWFLYQIDPQSAAYNIFDTALIRSDIDIPALQRAWQKMVNRHLSYILNFKEPSLTVDTACSSVLVSEP